MKKKTSYTLTAADLAGLCRFIVAEQRRAKKSRSSREALRIVMALIDRVLKDLLFEIEERADGTGMSDMRFLLEAIEEAREENLAFSNIGRSPPCPLIPVHTPKAEKAAIHGDKEAA